MSGMRVSLFITCLADLLFPEVGVATVRLLRHLGVQVDFPQGQTCCGQAMWNSGFRTEAAVLARQHLAAFGGSDYIVAPSGSCAGMVCRHYEELFRDEPALLEQARQVAARTYELSQFLVDVLGVEDLGASYRGRAVYHNGCHMARVLGVSDPPLRLLRRVRGLELVEMERPDLCCGFGGTFSIKQPEISVAMADEKIEHLNAAGADLLVSADLGCLMQLEGRLRQRGAGVRTLHLATLLAEGVGLA